MHSKVFFDSYSRLYDRLGRWAPWLVLLVLGIGYFVVGKMSTWVGGNLWSFRLHTAMDDQIPFLPSSVYLYLLYYPLWLAPLWSPLTHNEKVLMTYRMLRVGLLAWVLFLLAPAQPLDIGRNTIPSGLLDWTQAESLTTLLVSLIYSADPPSNYFPSLHVAHGWIVLLAHWRSPASRRPLKYLLLIMTVGMSLSTVLIKQHYVLDLLVGWLAGVAIAVTSVSNRRSLHVLEEC